MGSNQSSQFTRKTGTTRSCDKLRGCLLLHPGDMPQLCVYMYMNYDGGDFELCMVAKLLAGVHVLILGIGQN